MKHNIDKYYKYVINFPVFQTFFFSFFMKIPASWIIQSHGEK